MPPPQSERYAVKKEKRMKKVFLLCALLCLTVSSVEAGFYSQSYDASGSIAVALQFDNKEIYNLIVSI